MKIFYTEKHTLHDPSFEVFDGGVRTPYLETPNRMQRILSHSELSPWAEILPPEKFSMKPILEVHSAEYVDFLRTAYDEWQLEETDYVKEALIPATFPPRAKSRRPGSLLGKPGIT